MRLSLFCATITLLACSTPFSAQAQTADQLVGRWGLAAYWKATDAQNARKWAAAACNQPYVIAAGKAPGTVMMHIADEPQVRELKLVGKGKAAQLVPSSDAKGGVAHHTRTVSGFDGKSFELVWQDAGVASRYGINVYVRCR